MCGSTKSIKKSLNKTTTIKRGKSDKGTQVPNSIQEWMVRHCVRMKQSAVANELIETLFIFILFPDEFINNNKLRLHSIKWLSEVCVLMSNGSFDFITS